MGKRNRPTRSGDGSTYRSRAEREARLQRWVLRIVIGISLVLAIILFVVFVYSQFIAPGAVVARVFERQISAAEFQQRYLLERALINNQLNNIVSYYQTLGLSIEEINQQLLSDPQISTWQNELTIPDQLGIRVIRTLVEEALIQQRAQDMGISIGEEEIEAERAAYFNFSAVTATPLATATATDTPSATLTPILSPTPSEAPTETPIPPSATPTETPPDDATAIPTAAASHTPTPTRTPIPTLTSAERRENYESNVADFHDFLRGTGVRQSSIDAWYEALAWRAALEEAMREDVSETPYVALRHILVNANDATLVDEILAALAAGESFTALASEHSIDPGSAARGGFYDYAPVDPDVTTYVPEFAAAALSADVGEIVGPVATEFGQHIIQVVGRENRPTDEFQAADIQEGRFTRYLENLLTQEENSGNVETSAGWINHLPG
ncbi:MAG: peptidylprolyl isomerase [Chloroflexi bacterium]|nr:peptidylprolyl isomerase [Chloroflexota bacterium]